MRHERNKKAPAHFKAEEEYILSSKLVCGHCGTYMCGESGTGRYGIKYHYYKCMAVKKKKNNCKKKTVKKEWIEDIVIREITKIIFDDNTIESIISMVMKIQEEDNKEVPMYEKQLESVKRSIENMLNSIQMGVFTESTKQRLEELEQQKKNLEQQISELSFQKPLIIDFLTIQQVGREQGGDRITCVTVKLEVATNNLNGYWLARGCLLQRVH